MARLPLLNEHAAYSGERQGFAGGPPAREHLEDLVRRLRNAPEAFECEAAARILEHLARGGPRAWAAAGLKPAHPPRDRARAYAIWEAVNDLARSGVKLPEARKRIAKRERLSVSRVKAIHLEWERAKREHDRVTGEDQAD